MNQAGRVVVIFTFHEDGRITDATIVENTTYQMLASLCQKAVEDLFPWEAWSPEMQEEVEKSERRVRVAFHYWPRVWH